MRIIPAIDIIGGRCVRLTQGDYSSVRTYSDDPLAIARSFEDNGIKWLHLVDLDGAREKNVKNLYVLEKIASSTGLKIEFSGGIRMKSDIRDAFGAGAVQVSCGSIAAQNRELFLEWLDIFGNSRIVLGADARNRMIATSGWLDESTSEVTEYIKEYKRQGVKYVICTDIDRDGMLEGPSAALYGEILAGCNIRLIASGGITSLEDLALLRETGCDGAIIGKAIYEGKIGLKELGELCSREE
ncbi:MAG: 1-(5-phosphoribosyl)-5-[(5-phosphoribosylamino)methylideneamino]imidazole-4-carboxamide isomerase [Bacteroidales bacterium]|nr:1-(5-phosphoribosyl)-5-[(5-phosphoribosylamino)methylideneamino]imidazole-4-carboxamide isomerase [Bacteroidales bacterium]